MSLKEIADRRTWTLISNWIAVFFALFTIYTAVLKSYPPLLHRATHVGFVLVLVFLSPKIGMEEKKIGLLDILFGLLSVSPILYLWLNYDYVSMRIMYISPLKSADILFGTILVLLIIIATWKLVGKALSILTTVFLLYTIFGHHLSGALSHTGFTMTELVDQFFLTPQGTLGIPVGVSANYIALFIIFGAFLRQSGAAEWFMDLSKGLASRTQSGPGQMAVYSSALFGTLSGAGVANVVTTGQITIPLMIKMGYKPSFAGAVEATASLGGQIMPPVMASVAFLMAEMTGIPYITILRHALLPAILYFLAVSLMVHFEALKTVDYVSDSVKIEEKSFREVFLEGWFFLLPIVVLIALLMLRYTPSYAAFYSLLSTIVVGIIPKKSSRMGLVDIYESLAQGGKTVVIVGIACAAAGIVMGVVSLTGLGRTFSSIVMALSGESLLIALLFTAAATIIFGMGLPTPAAYILCVSLIIPAIIRLGVMPIAAHMFAIYFAVISTITPPVAISCFAAAALSGANFWDIAKQSMKLGMAGYIVPFIFIYSPALLLAGDNLQRQFLAFITAPLGIVLLAVSLQGYLFTRVQLLQRILFFGASICLIVPGLSTDIIGLFFGLILFFDHRRKSLKERAALEGGLEVNG